MRVLLYLGLSVALLCLMVFADHEDGHEKKGDHQHHGPDPHHEDKKACHKLADSNSKFAYDVYSQVTADHPGNMVFSPLSISTALSFLSLGARAQTHDQIIRGIGFNTSEIPEKEIDNGFHHLLEMLNDADRELQVHTGNGLFISQDRKILDDFLDNAKKLYHSEAFTTDFTNTEEAKKQINDYVEKKTNGMIPDVMSSVDNDAALVLVNFIYFLGKWERPFDPESTKEGDFHVNKDLTVKVPFMSRIGHYQTAFLDEATVVSVDYKGNASMLFILPKEGKMKEVDSNLRDTVKKFKKSRYEMFLHLRIPKFSISGSFDLKTVLPKFGIVDMFSDSADLSGITGAPNLKISKAMHKAKMTVDEKGTEAAGITVMEAVPMMLPQRVHFNGPFSYLLYDRSTRSILFMGKVENPQK